MSNLNKSFFFTVILLFFFIQLKAQVIIFEKNTLEKIQNGETHIIVGDPHFPHADEFLEVFKKYWTITKGVDYIAKENLTGNMVAGDTYFSLEANVVTGSNGGGNIYVYLNLWQPTSKALKDKKYKISHEAGLAHVVLSVDVSTMVDSYFGAKNLKFDFDGGGHFYHWNAGFLKNYLQMLVTQIKTGRKFDYHDDITDKSQLGLLKNQTLYCPEDNLNKMGTFVKIGKMNDIKDIFEDYKFNYKSISDSDLGEQIMKDTEPFYYLLFVRNSNSKLVLVINSRTGELVYSRHSTSMSAANLKSGDVKDIYKVVKKD